MAHGSLIHFMKGLWPMPLVELGSQRWCSRVETMHYSITENNNGLLYSRPLIYECCCWSFCATGSVWCVKFTSKETEIQRIMWHPWDHICGPTEISNLSSWLLSFHMAVRRWLASQKAYDGIITCWFILLRNPTLLVLMVHRKQGHLAEVFNNIRFPHHNVRESQMDYRSLLNSISWGCFCYCLDHQNKLVWGLFRSSPRFLVTTSVVYFLIPHLPFLLPGDSWAILAMVFWQTMIFLFHVKNWLD